MDDAKNEDKRTLQKNKSTSDKTAQNWILLQNICSLTKNIDEFKIFTSETEIYPVAICLTETWMKNVSKKNFLLNRNILRSKHPKEQKREDGVCIFVHNKMTRKRVASADTISLQAINLEIKTCCKTYLVTCIDIPPNASKAESFGKLFSFTDRIIITPCIYCVVTLMLILIKKSSKLIAINNQMEMNALALVEPQVPTREQLRKTCSDVLSTNCNKKVLLRKLQSMTITRWD